MPNLGKDTLRKQSLRRSANVRVPLKTTAEANSDWTFRDISTQKYTHGIHLYPARMHPEIARRVISKYAHPSDVVFDPFMGSGGVLLESILHGNNAVGLDINPLAVLISKVKTTIFKNNKISLIPKFLETILSDSNHAFKRGGGGRQWDNQPNLLCSNNLYPSEYDTTGWFDTHTLIRLGLLKRSMIKVTDDDILNFFKICFSLTVRKSSWQRSGSWKIHRIPELDRCGASPDPFAIFNNVCNANIKKIKNLAMMHPVGRAYPLLGNTKEVDLNFKRVTHILQDKKANLVVTSPPYGDHKTTVAYGQFSRHLSHWLDLPVDEVRTVDSMGLGGKNYKTNNDLESPALGHTLTKIQKNDVKLTKNKKPCRDREVYAYFYDLDQCLEQISQCLVTGKSHACFVVANRTVRRITIPTDTILIELGRKYGFVVKNTMQRQIPNKRMPIRNAPENITNAVGKTMTQESIIIMRC